MKDEIFYVYVDKTDDGRVFYVGKGKRNRITLKKRNEYWLRIAEKYGHFREVILGTKDEKFAFEVEKTLIKEYKTFAAKWAEGEGYGANFTEGGEGHSGRTGELSPRYKINHTEETKRKMSGENHRLFGKVGPNIGKIMSEETKLKISKSKKGQIISEDQKRKLSESLKGRKLSQSTRDKISKSHTGVTMSQESKEKISKARRNRSPVNEKIVIDIRNKYLTGNYSYKSLSEEYRISQASTRDIIIGNTWAHLPVFLEEMHEKGLCLGNGKGNSNMCILNEKQVIEILEKYSSGKYTQNDLAKEYNITRASISSIITQRTWKHLSQRKDK